jgi:hypothetical protein
MVIARIHTVITRLAGTLLIASCASHRVAPEGPPISNNAIIFQNQGHDRIQVYLIGQREERLLGRLEPLETARLQLPQWVFDGAPESVILAVIPGWSKDLRPSHNTAGTFSIKEFKDNLPGEAWSFVAGQLNGPWRGQHPDGFR